MSPISAPAGRWTEAFLGPWFLLGGKLLVWIDGRLPFVHLRVGRRVR
jgi:hypothetical protein